MHARGLVIEVPISVHEALAGASVTLPSLDEPVTVKIPPGSQSGAEIRLKGRGVLTKEGDRGDMFYRLMVHVPGAVHAVGIAERAAELEKYYESPVRQALPKTLLEV
jgi:DnaJ-class molecular chaperone